MTDEIRFATVEVHASPWEAHVSRALLESEGIPAFLAGEHHVGAIWPMSMALGGVRLVVPAQHAARAFEVLTQRDGGEFEAALREQAPFTPWACRTCGSTALREVRSGSAALLSFLLLFVAGNAIFPPWKERRCVACGGNAAETD